MSNAEHTEFLRPIRNYAISHISSSSDQTLCHYQILTKQDMDNLTWITCIGYPHMITDYAIQLWDYGLDQFYIRDWRFRKLYNLWCTTNYNLPFDTFLIKCGIQLTDLEAAQTAIVNSIIPGTLTNTSAYTVDG